MTNCKQVHTPLVPNSKLSTSMSLNSIEEWKIMECVPYLNAISNLMYAMIGTRGDIADAMGVVSQFMANLGQH